MGQEEGKQRDVVSQNYTVFRTLSTSQFLVHQKKKNQELLLRIMTFYLEDQMAQYLKLLDKRKKIKNKHLLELVQHTRISQHNMCSSTFKIKIVVEYPFKTIKEEVMERTISSPKRYFSEDEMWSILYSCCHALYSLYFNKISHEALNSQQIFIDKSGLVKISDGVLVQTTKNYLSLMNQGTPQGNRYISPELVNLVEDNHFYFYQKQKSDTFILAMIMLQMGNLAPVNFYSHITKKFNFDAYIPAINQLRMRYTPKYCEIIEKMLTLDFKERPRLEDIIVDIEQKTVCTASSGNTSILGHDFIDKKDDFEDGKPFGANQLFLPFLDEVKDKNSEQKQVNRPHPSVEQLTFNKPTAQSKYEFYPVYQSVKQPDRDIIRPPIRESVQMPVKRTARSPLKDKDSARGQVKQPVRQIVKDSFRMPPKLQTKNEFPSIPLVYSSYQTYNNFQDKKDITPTFSLELPYLPSFEQYTKKQGLSSQTTKQINESLVNIALKETDRTIKTKKQLQYTPYQSLMTDYKPYQSSNSASYVIKEALNPAKKPNIKIQFQSNMQKTVPPFEQPKVHQPYITKIQSLNIYNGDQNVGLTTTFESISLPNKQEYVSRSQEEEKKKETEQIKMDKKLSIEDQIIETNFVVEDTQQGHYEGFKANGKRHGIGRLIFPDGGYYQGKWVNNFMQDFGKLYFTNGQLAYEGFFQRSQFSGEGKVYNNIPEDCPISPVDYTNLNPIDLKWISYEGEFLNDQRNGKGTMKFKSGQKFSGNFVSDRAEGEGVFYKSSGEMITGEWRGNIYQNPS